MSQPDDLQALSDAATQGEWRREEGPGAWNSGGIETTDGYPIVITGPDGDIPNEADRAYIVALVNAHREGRLAASPSPDTDAGLDVLLMALYEAVGAAPALRETPRQRKVLEAWKAVTARLAFDKGQPDQEEASSG